MSITLELEPELEQQLREAAAQVGLSPDRYIAGTLQQYLRFLAAHQSPKQYLSSDEATLLININRSLSAIEWSTYQELLAKRQAETLTSNEQDTLIALSDQIEATNVQRITYLVELARLRNTKLDVVMRELGLKPVVHV